MVGDGAVLVPHPAPLWSRRCDAPAMNSPSPRPASTTSATSPCIGVRRSACLVFSVFEASQPRRTEWVTPMPGYAILDKLCARVVLVRYTYAGRWRPPAS